MDNLSIAQRLVDHANSLEGQGANIYRIRAYRQAAETIMGLEEPLESLVARQGRKGLEELPGIGSHLSFAIESLVRTGEFRTVNGEDGHVDPERLLTSLPGVGPRLARRIRNELGINTLEEVEQAAHDGRLGKVLDGPKRLRGIIDALAWRLSRFRLPEPTRGEPGVAEFLAIDEEYRKAAELGELATISPRRFNPHHEPWLPLFKGSRYGWSFRARFSNTAMAHRLGQTHDWVVVFFDDGIVPGQRTIVTENRGELRGRRVVRGRERECRQYYQTGD
jgi:hypothetical protein